MNQPNTTILTHSEAGNALLASSGTIVGKTSHTTTISLTPEISPEALMQQAKTILNPDVETTIFTDIHDDIPSNTTYLLLRKFPTHCISGVSLAMLIEANMLQDSDKEQPFDEYIQRIHDVGKKMIQTYCFNKG